MSEELSRGEQERLVRAKQARRRKIKKVFIWVIVLAAIAVGIYGLVIWSAKFGAEKPGQAVIEMSSREHIPVASPKPDYNSNPPTSGPHYAVPANWAIYDHELPDEQLVHNLEHGGIWISYKDASNTELISQLSSIADDFTLKVIMTPRADDPDPIDVAAWGRVLRLQTFDEKQIREFISAFINRGPEQVPY